MKFILLILVYLLMKEPSMPLYRFFSHEVSLKITVYISIQLVVETSPLSLSA